MKLYTIDCPKCKVLKSKLDLKNLKYEIITDIDEMKSLGISSLPYLEVDGKLLSFVEAVNYINKIKEI